MTSRSLLLAPLAIAAIVFAACGDDDGGGGVAPTNDGGASDGSNVSGDGSTNPPGDAGADAIAVPAITVDTSFGTGGITRVGRDGSELRLLCSVRQSSGKIVLVGRNAAQSQTEGDLADIVALRLDGSGQRDTTFGLAGASLRLLPMGVVQRSVGCAIGADDRIVVTALAIANDGTRRLLLARFTADGALDPTLGAGKGWMFVGTSEPFARPLVQPDGKIVVPAPNRSLLRFEADGTKDTTFNGVGMSGSSSALSVAVARQADGKLVLLTNNNGFTVLRFDTAGVVDNMFASPSVNSVNGSAVGIDGAGNIVVAAGGQKYYRYTSTGAPDTAFGSNGVLTGSTDDSGLYVEPDGRIVVIRRSGSTSAKLARYLADGSGADNSFAGTGVTTNSVTGTFSDILRAADGQLFLAGTTTEGAPRVASWDSGGATVTTWGTNGEANTTGGPSRDALTGVVAQPDGSLVGFGYGPYTQTTFLTRFTSAGALDTSFGAGGYALQSIGGWEQVGDLANDAAGNLYLRLRGGIAIAKFSPAGVRDAAYTGLINLDFGGAPVGESLAVLADGRVVAGGGTTGKIGVGRLTAAGALDTTFGGGTGKSVLDVPGVNEGIGSVGVAMTSDGKIVALGSTKDKLVVARFDSVGAGDPGFASGGVAALTNAFMEVESVLPAADGSITVVGIRRGASSSAPLATLVIVRVTPLGGLDTTFGLNGVVTQPLTIAADGYLRLSASTLLADGSLLVGTGKSAADGARREMLFWRFSSKGTLVGETVVPPSAGNDIVNAITRRADGTFVAVGSSWTETGSTDMALVGLK